MQHNGGVVSGGNESLSSTRPVVLVVSLTVGRGGHVIRGEAFDPETGRMCRFVDLDGFVDVVHDWLAAPADHPLRRPGEEPAPAAAPDAPARPRRGPGARA
jgi:hypothetical protein